jgi:Zn-dependent M28 family amino/carboxypeptidase
MALDFAIGPSVHAFSDHFPFFMAGVPTGGIQSAERSLEGRGYGHTRYDTVDKVEQKALREASTLAARLAMRVASADPWPAARRDEEAVLQLLDSPDYREEQEFRDRLDAFYVEARQG